MGRCQEKSERFFTLPAGNSLNGSYQKKIKGEFGNLDIAVSVLDEVWPIVEEAECQLEQFEWKWKARHPTIGKSWDNVQYVIIFKKVCCGIPNEKQRKKYMMRLFFKFLNLKEFYIHELFLNQ